MNLLRLATLLLMLAGTAAADVESDLRHAGSLGGIRLAESDEPAARKVYIVQLSAPPAAVFSAKTKPRARKTGSVRARFDKFSPDVQAYAARLAAEQDKALQKAGPDTELVYRYQYGLNGFAASMHPSQAHKLAALPEVLQVWEDEIRPLTTDNSVAFLGLFDPETVCAVRPDSMVTA